MILPTPCYRAAKERQRADAAAAEAAEKCTAEVEAARDAVTAAKRQVEEAAAEAAKCAGELRDYKVTAQGPDAFFLCQSPTTAN